MNFVHYQMMFLINSNAPPPPPRNRQSASDAKSPSVNINGDLRRSTTGIFWHRILIDKLIKKDAWAFWVSLQLFCGYLFIYQGQCTFINLTTPTCSSLSTSVLHINICCSCSAVLTWPCRAFMLKRWFNQKYSAVTAQLDVGGGPGDIFEST